MKRSEVEAAKLKSRSIWVAVQSKRRRAGAPVWIPTRCIPRSVGTNSVHFYGERSDVLFDYCYRARAECKVRCKQLRFFVTGRDEDKVVG